MCFGTIVAMAVGLGAPVAQPQAAQAPQAPPPAAVAAPAPIAYPEGIAQHVKDQIHWAVGGADIAALVTVVEPLATAARASVRVDEVLMGELAKGQTIELSPAKFIKSDLEPGKVLLVFLQKGGKAALRYNSTGRYELEIEGKIRDLPTADFLAATRAEAQAKLQKGLARQARANARPAAVNNPPGS